MVQYRSDIDGLRAVAVGGVVLFHALPWSLTGGFIGVDVFFVLSGFLITSIIRGEAERGEFSIAKFYERRFRRIMPALIAVAIVTTIASVIILPPTELKNYGKTLLGVATFASNIVFWMDSGYFDTASADKPLLHTWSLAVEEQFYILWPLIAAALVKTGRKYALPIFVAATVLVSLVLAVQAVRIAPDQAFYLLPYRAWELGIGALLAVGAVPAVTARPVREALALLGLLLIVVPMVLYTEATPFPGLAALPPCLGAFLIIHAGANGPTLVGRALSFRPILFVGLVSYSFYLWHWPLLVLPRVALSRELTTAEALASVAASFVLAVLSTNYVEARFRGRGTVKMTRRTVLTASVAAAAATGAVGLALFGSNGLHFLAGPGVLQAERAVADINPYRDACHADKAGELADYRTCVTGTSDRVAGYDVLLWGDSHADHLMPGLIPVAAARHIEIRQATVSGCSPVSQFVHYGDHPKACPIIYQTALNEAGRQRDIDAVIVSARWSAILPGINDKVTHGNTPAALAKFDTALRSIVAQIRERLPRARIILVGSTPEFDVWPANCFARAAKLGTDRADCDQREATDERWGPLADQVIARLAGPGVTVVLPRQDFCKGDICESEKAGAILFRDDDHLTTAGSALIARRLISALPTS